MGQRHFVYAVAERVIPIDPARVWSLLGDPSRLGEWAGVRLVGYMGTELPRPGHSVFVRRKLLRRRSKRVEIESWVAGERIVCLVHGQPEPVRFEMVINPEVGHDTIGTRVRLVQRFATLGVLAFPARWWVERQLERKMSRIGRAAKP
ncbi:MAG: SRPBCC family protein [Acidimicrobiia bacterium]|nr:SRPBCC family protein [Acidimicrobiia bacterium]